MQYQSVRAVASRLKSQFKVDMDIFDVVQGCSDALKKMGMISLVRYGIVARVENFTINLPGYIWKPRGVIRLSEIPEEMKEVVDGIYFPPQILFKFDDSDTTTTPESFKDNYVGQFKGPWVEHVWDAPYLRFNENDVLVGIEATGIKLDDEGFPMLPEPAFFGCLYYCLFIYQQPLFLVGQIPHFVMKQTEEWKDRNIAQSNANMMLESLDSNERDKLFDIMTSFNRKTYGFPI
jgi:hypothetical protein